MNVNNINQWLEKNGQEHVLQFENELNKEEKNELYAQISDIDFSVLNSKRIDEKRGKFSPLGCLNCEDIEQNREEYEKIGIDAIKNGKVGAVLLAGGQGSRLGFDKPKGCFNIGVNKTLYIFECLINNLLDVVKKANAWIPLFIMTSEQNDADTRKFFEDHRYFGYSKDNIIFFTQEQYPAIDKAGKLLMFSKSKILTAPNGNGGWYSSMEKSGILDLIHGKIEWLNVFAVDNVLQKMADPCFIGAVIKSGKHSGAKVVSKVSPDEKVGVLCLEDGKPSIVEYYEMTDEMRNLRNKDGKLAYNYGVILNYLFKVEDLNKMLNIDMPLHKVLKKLKYYDTEKQEIVNPSEPNGYKFETLVLDMVKMQDSCLAYEVERNKEFAPVKNATGNDSVDTARKLLQENGIEI